MAGRISIPGSLEPMLDFGGRANARWRRFFEEISGENANPGDVLTVGNNGTEFMPGSGSYVTLDTSQTITGLKDFTTPPTINGEVIWTDDNVGFRIDALTADATPDSAADYVVTYDADAGTAKKVLLEDLSASSEWGNITGTLSDQTDLQAVLDDRELLAMFI